MAGTQNSWIATDEGTFRQNQKHLRRPIGRCKRVVSRTLGP